MDVVKLILIISIVIVSETEAAGFNTNWNYVNSTNIGPWNWKSYASKCAGTKQSPINIVTANVKYNSTLKKLVLGNYRNTEVMQDFVFELKNGGHAVHVELKRTSSADLSPVTITFEHITWRFVQFHFHWGSVSTQGSEHTIDGKHYPAEMHMIHYNTKYKNFATAIPQSDGLLVWGHLFEVSASTNTNFQKLITYFTDVPREGLTKNVPLFPLSSLIPDDSEEDYYTYSGSLTTPTCDETVRWVISKNIITLSSAQLDEFRKLRQSNNVSITTKISDNFRPTQGLNGRLVEKSFGSSSITIFATILSICVPLVTMLINSSG